jgi:hypothetical protein
VEVCVDGSNFLSIDGNSAHTILKVKAKTCPYRSWRISLAHETNN